MTAALAWNACGLVDYADVFVLIDYVDGTLGGSKAFGGENVVGKIYGEDVALGEKEAFPDPFAVDLNILFPERLVHERRRKGGKGF